MTEDAEARIVRRVIRQKSETLVAKAIRRLQRQSASILGFGKGTPLHNMWEVWVSEMQGYHSIAHDEIEDYVQATCGLVVDSISPEDLALLFTAAEEFDAEKDWGDLPGGEFIIDAVAGMLMRKVSSQACDAPLNARLEEYIHPPHD